MKTLILSLVSLLCLSAQAKTLIVLYDGPGDSVAPYLESLAADNAGEDIPVAPAPIKIGNPVPASLPVTTPQMKAGRLPALFRTQAIADLHVPIAIVGADPLSLKWLEMNRDKLVAMGAEGVVVNVSSMDELEQLKEAGGIRMSPVSGEAFFRIWNISHYPVLVTHKGVQQ